MAKKTKIKSRPAEPPSRGRGRPSLGANGLTQMCYFRLNTPIRQLLGAYGESEGSAIRRIVVDRLVADGKIREDELPRNVRDDMAEDVVVTG